MNPCGATLGYLLFGQTYLAYTDTIDARLVDLLPDSTRPAPLLDLPGSFPEVARRLLLWMGAVAEAYRPFVDGVGTGCPGNAADDLWGTAQQLVPFALWGSAELLYSFYTKVVEGSGLSAILRIPTLVSPDPDTVRIPVLLDFPAGSLQAASFALTYAPDTGLTVVGAEAVESLLIRQPAPGGGGTCSQALLRTGSPPDSLALLPFPGGFRVFLRYSAPVPSGRDGLLLVIRGVLHGAEVRLDFLPDCRENWVLLPSGDTLWADSLSAGGGCGGMRTLGLRGGWVYPPPPTALTEQVGAFPGEVEVRVEGEDLIVRFPEPVSGPLRVAIYDRAGRRHRETRISSGEREVVLPLLGASGAPLPGGLYFLVLEGESFRATRRFLLVR